MDFIAILEAALGAKAKVDLQPMQPGDVPETFADITMSTRDFGFSPKTPLEDGIRKFVAWYKSFYTA